MHSCPWYHSRSELHAALTAIDARFWADAEVADIYRHTYSDPARCPHVTREQWLAIAAAACDTLAQLRNRTPAAERDIDRAIDILDPRQRYAETVLTVCAVLVSTIVVAAILASWVRAL